MSKLEELIEELCPDGVERKTLGELGKFYGGLTGKSKDDFTDGNAKFITYKNVYSNPALDLHPKDTVKIAKGEKQRTLQYGDIIFTGSSETPDECGFASVVTDEPDEDLYLNSFCFFLRMDDTSILNPDFAKHLFRCSDLRVQIGKTASGVTRFNVSKKLMEKVIIPIPPLPVQEEIVRILDNFTDLTAELQAELQARAKQYEYYRDTLLTFGDDVEIRQLSEVADVIDSLHATPKYTDKGYSMIRVADVKGGYVDTTTALKVDEETYIKFIKRYKPQHKDIIVSRVGSFGNFSLVPDEDVCLGQNVALIHPNINNKYLYYYLRSKNVFDYLNSNAHGGGYKNIGIKDILAIPIKVPSLERQEKIANILEKFELLCADVQDGLPAEIEARQKQYEYYRNKLLTFKELGA